MSETQKIISPLAGFLAEVVETLQATGTAVLEARMAEAIELLTVAVRGRRMVLLCGNGSSAADALRIAAEMVGRHKRERVGFKMMALSANTSTLTGLGNDYGFDSVFARQVQALGEPGGVVWGFSTSGNSPNVVEAFRRARELNMHTLGFTGGGGGAMAEHSDILIDVPVRISSRVQEIQFCLSHYLCEQVESLCVEPYAAGA